MENVRKFWRKSVKLQFIRFRSSKDDDGSSSTSTYDPFCDINLDEENDNSLIPHTDYLFNVLAVEQMRKYLVVVQDVEYLFRNAAHRLNLATETWKSTHGLPQKTNDESFSTQTKMGLKLVEITSILENLLQRDAVLFYTAGDKELISQLLTPLNHDMGKLARKTLRLCQQTGELQKAIFELVERHTPSSDEAVFVMEADESETESVTDEAITIKPSKIMRTVWTNNISHDFRKKLDRLWDFLTECIPSTKVAETETKIISSSTQLPPPSNLNMTNKKFRSKRLSCKDELTGFRTAQASQELILRTPHAAKTTETTMTINKESLCLPLDASTMNFIVAALTPPTSSISNYNGLNDPPLHEWRKKSYQKVMQDTLGGESNDSLIDDFYSDFEQDTRALSKIQKKIDEVLNSPCPELYSDTCNDLVISSTTGKSNLEENCNKKIGDNNLQTTDGKDDMHLVGCSVEYEKEILPGKCQLEDCALADGVLNISSESPVGESKADEPSSYKNVDFKFIARRKKTCGKNLDKQNDNCGRFPLDPMTNYEYTVSEMSFCINDLISCLRSLENFWLQPELPNQNESSQTRELAELVDYIVFTIHALEDPRFIEQLYVEDRNEMIERLNVVADAVQSCMTAFIELTRVILKDAQYLQTMIDHFPSDLADIIVYEHTML